MDQKITVKIAEKEYVLKAPTPEHEEYIRLAAATVNKRLNAYLSKYPDRNPSDLLSFVALNECIGRLRSEREMENARAEAGKLKADTDAYLSSLDK